MNNKTLVNFMSADRACAYFLASNGEYNPQSGKLGGAGKQVYTDKLSFPHILHGLSSKEIAEMIHLLSDDVKFQSVMGVHSSCLHNEFIKQLKAIHSAQKNNKFIKRNYKILAHMVTAPDAPQVWRRMIIGGATNMKQFDSILRKAFGFGTHSSYFKIPLNNKYFIIDKKTKKLKDIHTGYNSKYFRKKILLFNGIKGSMDNYCFQHLYKPYSISMECLLFGHIAPIFYNLYKNNENINKIPFDQFKKHFFPGFNGNKYSRRTIADTRWSNFDLTRNDCIQFVYDLGDQYSFNIYVEEIGKITNENDTITCEYLGGSSCGPPEDIGGAYDWYQCILLCYGYSLKQIRATPSLIEAYKNGKDVYEWIRRTTPEYYDIFCLADSEQYLSYSEMKKHPFNLFIRRNVLSRLETSKLILYKNKKSKLMKRINTDGMPFYFPYLVIDHGVNAWLSSLNNEYNRINMKYIRRKKSNMIKLKYCLFCEKNDVKLKICG
eukprot:476298_1